MSFFFLDAFKKIMNIYAFLLNIINILSILMSVEIKKMFNIITHIYQIPGSLSQYLLISLFPVKVVLFIWLLKASYSKILIILMQIMQINEKITILVCWTRLGRKRYKIKINETMDFDFAVVFTSDQWLFIELISRTLKINLLFNWHNIGKKTSICR